MENNYISSVKNQFKQAKIMAEKAIDQIPDEKIYWQFNPATNSIAIIVKHLAGNMLSRFTDFYTSDGEKKWRDRDAEFENEHLSRESLKALWDKGWDCLFEVLNGLSASDLSKVVVIRNEELTVIDAINRQLTHYSSHIGQIIFIAKMVQNDEWKTLTIPKNGSRAFNVNKGL